jgi:peptidyl-prolyl cis-trans isomerase C
MKCSAFSLASQPSDAWSTHQDNSAVLAKLSRSALPGCFLGVLALCAATAWGQSTSTAPKSPAPTVTPGNSSASPATPGLQPRGPDAIAKQQPNKVVATIDGKQITAKEAADLLNAIPPQLRSGYQGSLANLVQQSYTQNQVAALALKESLEQKSPWRQQLQWSRDNILAQAYLRNLMDDPAEATKAKQYYDAHPADFDQFKISGILVAFNAPGTPASSSAAAVTRTEADAQAKAADLENKLKAGGDFAGLARTDSDLQQTSSKGGDMGTFILADSNIPAEIKNAVAKLQPGQVSEPVRGAVGGMNGFLIIKVDNRTRVAFDQVKSGLIQKIELDKYAIHVEDPDFFSVPATTPVPSLARPNAPATSTSPSPGTPAKPPAK